MRGNISCETMVECTHVAMARSCDRIMSLLNLTVYLGWNVPT